MNQRRFHNALRILNSIDRHDLVNAGILSASDEAGWRLFRSNPYQWMIRCGDGDQSALFELIEQRQPKSTPPSDLSAFRLPLRVEQMICVGGRGPVLVDDDGCQIATIGPLLGDIGQKLAEALAFAVNSYADQANEIERLKTGQACANVVRASTAQRIEPIVAMARAE